MLAIAGYHIRLRPVARFSAVRLGPTTAPRPDAFKLGNAKAFLTVLPGDFVSEGTPFERVQATIRRGRAGTEVHLGGGVEDVEILAQLETGPLTRHWAVETEGFACRWPPGLGLASTPAGAAWPFEFYGPNGAFVFLRGPLQGEQVPTPQQMVGPGQELVDQEVTGNGLRMDLEYTHEGAVWNQRHHWVGFAQETAILLTGQAPRDIFAGISQAMDVIVASLRLSGTKAPAQPKRGGAQVH
jgi:hypothetical protein